jgi:hypothetical protein
MKQAVKLPPLQQAKVGTLSTEYRSYAGLDVCRVDAAMLSSELDTTNEMLGELLRATSAGKEGYWTDEQLALLDEAQRTLSPVLDAHEATLQGVSACPTTEEVSWADTVRVGTELSGQARRRIAEAPALLAYVRAIREVKSWREKQAAEQKRRRREDCPERPGKVPVLYYAWEDAVGKTEWLFCDGSKVFADQGKPPELNQDPEQRPKNAPPAEAYLQVAAKYPAAEIRRSPRLPKATPTEEQEEKLDLE